MDLVKRQLLLSISALSVPIHRELTEEEVERASGAAKLIRNRLLREHVRVREAAIKIEQQLMYELPDSDGDSGADPDEEDCEEPRAAQQHRSTGTFENFLISADRTAMLKRTEFLFVCEMMLVERVVVPLLLAHGMRNSDSLLPQLLKLLTAILSPIPKLSYERSRQYDFLQRMRIRCASDDFFSLLVQCVAPITERRRENYVKKNEAVLIELVLTVVAHLTDGRRGDVEIVVGSLCRNHGMELLLVIVSQNQARMERNSHGLLDDEEQSAESANFSGNDAESAAAADDVDAGEKKMHRHDDDVFSAPDSSSLSRGSAACSQNVPFAREASPLEFLIAADMAAPVALTDDLGVAKELEVEGIIVDPDCIGPLDDDGSSTCAARDASGAGDEDKLSSESFDVNSCAEKSEKCRSYSPLSERQKGLKNSVSAANGGTDAQGLWDGAVVETHEVLARWNDLVLRSISSALSCASPSEMAQHRYNFAGASAGAAASPLPTGCPETANTIARALSAPSDFLEYKREVDNWRHMARLRCGATVSSGIVVRRDNMNGILGTVGTTTSDGGDGTWATRRTIGSVDAIFGSHHQSVIDCATEIDLKKRGRFFEGMFEESHRVCNLPLPSKLSLAAQCEAFLCHGFEPLASMLWPRLMETFKCMEREHQEYKEVIASYRNSGERAEALPTAFGATDEDQCQQLRRVFEFMNVAASLLRFTRETLRLTGDAGPAGFARVTALFKPLSQIISMQHIQKSLDFFLLCQSMKHVSGNSRDMTVVVSFVGELLMILHLLIHGDIVKDPAISMAAQALASSTLYREENLRAIFQHIPDSALWNPPRERVQSSILLFHAFFALMEVCSFNGSLILPKRQAHGRRGQRNVLEEAEGDGSADRGSSEVSEDDEGVATAPQSRASSIATYADWNAGNFSLQPLPPTEHIELCGSSTPSIAELLAEKDDAVSLSSARGGASPAAGSSVHTMASSLCSERDVSIGSFVQRLSTTRYTGLLLLGLRSWRSNDVDVNLGLVSLLRSVMENHIGVFFNASFMLVFREIVQQGQRTHFPLFNVCDEIVYRFFNPAVATEMNSNADFPTSQISAESRECTVSTNSEDRLQGSSSFLGFEVSLRCARSLFMLNSTEYGLLEEKAISYLMDHTAIPLPNFEERDTATCAEQLRSESAARSSKLDVTETDTGYDREIHFHEQVRDKRRQLRSRPERVNSGTLSHRKQPRQSSEPGDARIIKTQRREPQPIVSHSDFTSNIKYSPVVLDESTGIPEDLPPMVASTMAEPSPWVSGSCVAPSVAERLKDLDSSEVIFASRHLLLEEE